MGELEFFVIFILPQFFAIKCVTNESQKWMKSIKKTLKEDFLIIFRKFVTENDPFCILLNIFYSNLVSIFYLEYFSLKYSLAKDFLRTFVV